MANLALCRLKDQPEFFVQPVVVRVISWLFRVHERFYQHHLWTRLGQPVPFAIVYVHVQPKVKNSQNQNENQLLHSKK